MKPKNTTVDAVKAAIDYMENNLWQDISLFEVSLRFGYSTYHFHRVFLAQAGESIVEYIRKRRLCESTDLLITRDASILEIASRCGFDSQEAYTRAFKKMFGLTPGQVRRLGRRPPTAHKFPTTYEMLSHLQKGVNMQPKIVERGPDLAVGMGGSFPHNSFSRISKLWTEFQVRMPEVPAVRKGYALGVCTAEHADIAIKPGDNFVYIAALPVTDAATVPAGMVKVEIPGGRYAVFTHKGPLSDLPHTVNYIWGTWVPRGEYKRRESPDFELYDERFNEQTLDGEFDIYLPIE
jgi:AraC family transcriptional regulator